MPVSPNHGKLQIFQGDTLLGEVSLEGRRLLIGRDPASDIHLDSPQVARKQALIARVGQEYVLTDMAGKETTLVNDQVVITHTILNSDVIVIGPYTLRCQINALSAMLEVLADSLDQAGADHLAKSFSTAAKGCEPQHKGSVTEKEVFEDAVDARDRNILAILVGGLVAVALFIAFLTW